jgi:hypothetical protein
MLVATAGAVATLWAQDGLSTDNTIMTKQLKHSAWRTQFERDGGWHEATVYFRGDRGWYVMPGSGKGMLSNVQYHVGGGSFTIKGNWSAGNEQGRFQFHRSSPTQGNIFSGKWGYEPSAWKGDWNGKLLYCYDPWEWSSVKKRYSCKFYYVNDWGTWTWNMVFWYPSSAPQHGWYFFANREEHFWGRCAGPGNPIYSPTVEKWAKFDSSNDQWEQQPDGDCLSPGDSGQSIPEGIPDNFPDPPA